VENFKTGFGIEIVCVLATVASVPGLLTIDTLVLFPSIFDLGCPD